MLGLLVMAGAGLLILDRASGGSLVAVAGGLGALLALANVIAEFVNGSTPGAGLWLFLVFSTGALASGVLSLVRLLNEKRPPAPVTGE